jgi:hypothetical protein
MAAEAEEAITGLSRPLELIMELAVDRVVVLLLQEQSVLPHLLDKVIMAERVESDSDTENQLAEAEELERLDKMVAIITEFAETAE